MWYEGLNKNATTKKVWPECWQKRQQYEKNVA